MDDLTQRYYEAEMRYLREAGKEFAQAYPDRAAMLNLDKPGARDPYVERLFEGFAFLMGRLREKLDDDLPELTEGLVSLLWPHYLRTIPSLSVVELLTDHRQMKQSETLSDFQVLSRPVGEHRTRCCYSATRISPCFRWLYQRCRYSTNRMDARLSVCALSAARWLATGHRLIYRDCRSISMRTVRWLVHYTGR